MLFPRLFPEKGIYSQFIQGTDYCNINLFGSSCQFLKLWHPLPDARLTDFFCFRIERMQAIMTTLVITDVISTR
jgi:hypothetical protein